MSDTRVYALDTSALSCIQRNQEPWVSRLREIPPAQRATPVIAVEEQLRGRLAQIAQQNRSGDLSAISQAYRRFIEALAFFNAIRVLPFDEPAIAKFSALRKAHKRRGTNDLRIAAITLTEGAVLVTANRVDFTGISGLAVETWEAGSIS